jgi:hypothetical protein
MLQGQISIPHETVQQIKAPGDEAGALPRRQPVHNETFIDLSIIKWVQYACVSTMKFQSSFFKLFIKHLRRSFSFQIKFAPITGELSIL